MDLKIQGGFGVRMYSEPMKAGQVVDGHDHNFPHLTYIPHGSMLFEELESESGEVVRSVIKSAAANYNFLLIKAGKWHRLTALEDGTLYHCIYTHRTPDGGISDEYDGWMPSYE